MMSDDTPTPPLLPKLQKWMSFNQELAQRRGQRDRLWKALLFEEVTLSDEEILAAIGHETPLRDFLKELRRGLLHVPALRGSHEVHRQPKALQGLLSTGRLIARNPDPQA